MNFVVKPAPVPIFGGGERVRPLFLADIDPGSRGCNAHKLLIFPVNNDVGRIDLDDDILDR